MAVFSRHTVSSRILKRGFPCKITTLIILMVILNGTGCREDKTERIPPCPEKKGNFEAVPAVHAEKIMIRQITAESDAKSVHPEKMHRETPGDNPILVEAKNNKLFDAEKWINCDYRFFKRVNPRMISEYDPIIKKMARRYGLDWRLVAAQIYTESCFKENAASGAGALGLMQIMPTTAKYLGFNENTLLNPEINIAIGCLYDQKMINAWGEQTKDYNRLGFALASYNSGRARVLRDYGRHDSLTTWQSVHPLLPEETQMYVHKIYLKHDLYRKNVLP